MITFKLNKEYIDLFENTALSIEGQSPLFSPDAIPGTKIFTFNAQKSKKNQRLFAFAEKIPVNSSVSFPDVEANLFNTLWRRGELRLRDASPRAYSLSFHTEAGDVAAKLRGKKLKDLDLGEDLLRLEEDQNLIYPERKYALFPVKNPDFYGETNPDFAGYLNNYENGAFVLNSITNRNAITPFPFLLYILNQIAKAVGYFGIKGGFTEEEDIKRLVIYNNRALDLLEGSRNAYNYTIYFKDHMPDLEAGSFLVAIKNLFNLSFNFNTKTKFLEIERARTFLEAPGFIDFTKISSADYVKTPYQNGGFALTMRPDNNDLLFKDLPEPADYSYIIEGGEERFESGAGTLQEITEARPGGGSWSLPYTKQKGSSPHFDLGDNPFSLRLLFYRGLQKDSLGETYPLGSAVGTYYKLGFSGFNGLYERSWRNWLEMLQSSAQIETALRFGASDLHNLNFNRKILREFTKYFIREYRVNISSRGIGPAQVILQSLKL